MNHLKSISTLAIASCLTGAPLNALAGPEPGTEASSKDVSTLAELPEPSRTNYTFAIPGWLTGIDGTLGVKGLSTGVSAGFDEIVKDLDMLAAGSIEVRRDKFGIFLEGLYLKASIGGSSPGPLLSDVSLGVEQVIAEGTLTYRILEGERGWLDALAGARYIYLGTELNLSVDSAGVQSASEELSAAIVDRATAAAKKEAEMRLPGLIAGLGDKRADLKAKAISDVVGRVGDRVDGIRDAIRDRIDAGIGSSKPGIGADIAGSGPIRGVVREYIKAKVEAELEARRAQASAAVAAARARARSKAERRLAKAEARLSKTIEKEITNRIPSSPVTASKDWVDPFVGFRGRYNLSDSCYLAGRADVGGFGVSSDSTLNLYGALGVEITERSSMEVGYRYLAIDYNSGGFSYDVDTKGPFVGLRIEF